ncbi:EF-hand domain-containing protein [Nodosilinea sp. P-1105]|uniref:EF-hand domain-containing protein n=1 Tax=Nodosilinea sp. P-1105 TaxID=2546229 RepID=UPI00146F0E41|nr:EF-hand domain-containing protein [Nodosilinea sp. P-1105]NMF83460.1 hypothetical protein [Nodosilinea sp. P-1105]
MKRLLISGLTITLSSLVMASAAMAGPLPRTGQTTLHDPAADLNGDGVVSISELVRYNRDQRQS